MLSERSINKIGKHLENEGWTDEEIAEAIESIDSSKRVVNIALPLHFKEEAIHHAYCHCKYVLNLKEGTRKYENAFKEAYMTYLTEAYENSRGVEGPSKGSHKKANPAGIEIHVFDKSDKKITSEEEKKVIAEKAPAGLVVMGMDGYLQRQFAELAKKKPEEIAKEIATQYSAAVVSLSNSFLFAFGDYKTKRKFGGTKVYSQGDDAEKTLEFSKKTGETDDKKKMLNVAYRQIARQIYIICMSSIIAGSAALDSEVVENIEKGIEKEIKKKWKQKQTGGKEKGEEPNLAFVLNRKIREDIVESFFNTFNSEINEYGKDSQGRPDKSKWSPRMVFLSQVQNSIKKWATKEDSSPQKPKKTKSVSRRLLDGIENS
jgi:hypothetical protein